MASKTLIARSLTLILLCVIAVAVTQWVRGESAELRELLVTQTANMHLQTATEIKRVVFDKTVTLGKPVYAQVVITYRPAGTFSQDDVFAEIVSYVAGGNSKESSRSRATPGYYHASLHSGSGYIFIEVFKKPTDNIVEVVLTNKG